MITSGDSERTCTGHGDGRSPVGEWNGTVAVCAGVINVYAL